HRDVAVRDGQHTERPRRLICRGIGLAGDETDGTRVGRVRPGQRSAAVPGRWGHFAGPAVVDAVSTLSHARYDAAGATSPRMDGGVRNRTGSVRGAVLQLARLVLGSDLLFRLRTQSQRGCPIPGDQDSTSGPD